MMTGTYAGILATKDLAGTFARLRAGDAEVVKEPTEQPYGGSPPHRPRSRGQADPHPGAAPSRPAIAPEVKRLGLIRRKEVLRNG
jgi:hypothetical protein